LTGSIFLCNSRICSGLAPATVAGVVRHPLRCIFYPDGQCILVPVLPIYTMADTTDTKLCVDASSPCSAVASHDLTHFFLPVSFVGGLAWATTNESLREAFEKFGAVQNAEVVYHRDTGKSRGFGFVIMEDKAGADAALAGVNNTDLDGRTVRVDLASRGGGGGGGGGTFSSGCESDGNGTIFPRRSNLLSDHGTGVLISCFFMLRDLPTVSLIRGLVRLPLTCRFFCFSDPTRVQHPLPSNIL
jgi:hypothetical protein